MSAIRRSEEQVVRLSSDDDLQTYIDTLAGHGPQHEALIEVDSADDLTSLRTKLESVRVPRAVLLIPSQVKCLRDGLEFRVLRRLQRELGLDLVIVSSDQSRRSLAQENGFRNVYRSLRAYYRAKSHSPDRSESTSFTDPEEFTPGISIGRWGLAMAGMLAVILGALAYVGIPLATVVVYPEAQLLARDIEMLVEIGGPRTDVTSQRLAGRLVQERLQVEGSINVKDVPVPSTPDGSRQPSGFQTGANISLNVRDALRDQLLKQASATATDRLRAQLDSGESMPDSSIRTEILGERYDHNIGDPAEVLGGRLDVMATGLAFSNDDFNKLAFALWSQDIPRGYVQLDNPQLTPPAVVSTEGQHMRLRVHATGWLRPQLDTGAIAAAVQGKTPVEAQKAVSALGDFARPPKITLWPEWATRAYRVQVKTVIQQTAEQQESSQQTAP